MFKSILSQNWIWNLTQQKAETQEYSLKLFRYASDTLANSLPFPQECHVLFEYPHTIFNGGEYEISFIEQ